MLAERKASQVPQQTKVLLNVTRYIYLCVACKCAHCLWRLLDVLLERSPGQGLSTARSTTGRPTTCMHPLHPPPHVLRTNRVHVWCMSCPRITEFIGLETYTPRPSYVPRFGLGHRWHITTRYIDCLGLTKNLTWPISYSVHVTCRPHCCKWP